MYALRSFSSIRKVFCSKNPSFQIAHVARRLEASIDPFDWDVFQTHLTANLHSLVRRTHCLYGAVAGHSTTVQALTSAAKAPFNQVRRGGVRGGVVMTVLEVCFKGNPVLVDSWH